APLVSNSEGSATHEARTQVHTDNSFPLYADVPKAATRPSDASDLPHRIVFKQAPLDSVIESIAEAFKLKIDRAPGLGNPTVDVDLAHTKGVELLKQLGAANGFGVVEEGAGRVL